MSADWMVAMAIALPVAFWAGCFVGLLIGRTDAVEDDPLDWFDVQ